MRDEWLYKHMAHTRTLKESGKSLKANRQYLAHTKSARARVADLLLVITAADEVASVCDSLGKREAWVAGKLAVDRL